MTTTQPLEALALANAARTDAQLNRLRRDAVTGEVYTHRGRIESGAYTFRTRHIQAGKRDTYGLILACEIGPAGVEYMTPVVNSTKLAYDYASDLPVVEFDEDHGTIEREITDAEWAHLTGRV